MRGVIRSVGTVAPVRKRDKAREEEYGSIRPMSTMEKWAMSAQEAYASKDVGKRLSVVPDIGPAVAGTTKILREIPDLIQATRGPGTSYLHFGPSKRGVNIQQVKEFLKKAYPDLEVDMVGLANPLLPSHKKFRLNFFKNGRIVSAPEDFETIWRGAQKQLPAPKVNRADRVGPMTQKAGSGEPYKSMPQSRIGEVSPTSVTPFELQQLGLSKGAEPWDMGSKTTLGPATRPKRGKK